MTTDIYRWNSRSARSFFEEIISNTHEKQVKWGVVLSRNGARRSPIMETSEIRPNESPMDEFGARMSSCIRIICLRLFIFLCRFSFLASIAKS